MSDKSNEGRISVLYHKLIISYHELYIKSIDSTDLITKATTMLNLVFIRSTSFFTHDVLVLKCPRVEKKKSQS